jgi:hypothetical protein
MFNAVVTAPVLEIPIKVPIVVRSASNNITINVCRTNRTGIAYPVNAPTH